MKNNPQITPNDQSNWIIVHLAFGTTLETTAGGKEGSSLVGIPEFPTVVLPVAAVLGIVLVLGRKKKQ